MNVLRVSHSREVIHHDVSKYVGDQELCSFDGIPFAGITDEVEVDTDLLGVLMELWVLIMLNFIVVVDKDLLRLCSLRVVV